MPIEKPKLDSSLKKPTISSNGITIPQERILDLLNGSVLNSLEGGKKGSRFPTLHAYLEMDGEDIANETVKKLRAEFAKVRDALKDSMELGVMEGNQFVPVSKIADRIYASSPDAGIFLRNVGLPRDFPANEKLIELVGSSIEMCDEAIRRDCGFGKYSKPS